MPILKPGVKGGRKGDKKSGARFCPSTVQCRGVEIILERAKNDHAVVWTSARASIILAVVQPRDCRDIDIILEHAQKCSCSCVDKCSREHHSCSRTATRCQQGCGCSNTTGIRTVTGAGSGCGCLNTTGVRAVTGAGSCCGMHTDRRRCQQWCGTS